MSTRKIATALGAAALLLGTPASYALAGQDGPGKPDKPVKVKECSDNIDNDGDGDTDFAEDGSGDPDCESANDNSESPEETGGGTPGLPGLPPGLPELPPGLPELPPGGGLPELPPGLPELPPGLPELPPGGGELPPLPVPVPGPGDLEALVGEVVATVTGLLPPPPAV